MRTNRFSRTPSSELPIPCTWPVMGRVRAEVSQQPGRVESDLHRACSTLSHPESYHMSGLNRLSTLLANRTENGFLSSSRSIISVQRSSVFAISFRTLDATEDLKNATPHSKWR